MISLCFQGILVQKLHGFVKAKFEKEGYGKLLHTSDAGVHR